MLWKAASAQFSSRGSSTTHSMQARAGPADRNQSRHSLGAFALENLFISHIVKTAAISSLAWSDSARASQLSVQVLRDDAEQSNAFFEVRTALIQSLTLFLAVTACCRARNAGFCALLFAETIAMLLWLKCGSPIAVTTCRLARTTRRICVRIL